MILIAAVLAAVLAAPATADAAPGDADLETTTSSAPTPALPVVGGTAIVFSTVSNQGPEVATDVVVTFSVPVGFHVSGTTGGCSVVGSDVSCPLASLAVGAQRTFRVDLDQLTEGTHRVSVSASSDLPDPDGSTSTRDLVVVPESADLLGIDRTDQARVGARHSIAHIFKDEGPTAAFGASLAGTFPSNAVLVPGSFEFGTGVTDLTATHCTVTATTYACAPLSSDPVNTEYLPAYVQYRIDLPATAQVVTAEATITGRADPDPSNDTSTVTVEVVADAPDLGVEWTNLRPVAAGERFSAGATLSNRGQGIARDVVLTFTAPEGWLVEDLEIYRPTCTAGVAGRTVVCRYATLGPGASTSPLVGLTAPSTARTAEALTVSVTTSTPQVGTGPDVDEGLVDVLALGADLVGTGGTASPSPVDPGQPTSTVTWGFRNASTDRVATDAAVSVSVPATVRLVSLYANATPGTTVACTIAADGRTGRCEVTRGGYLYPGREIVVTGFVAGRVGGTFALTATAEQSSTEAVPGDEVSTAELVVPPIVADLRVASLPPAEEVTVGETFSYLVAVANVGPRAETAPVLDVAVPAGITVVSARRGWFAAPCQVTSASIRCGFAPLAAGASNFVVVTARAGGPGRTVTGLAVHGEQVDPDPSSNLATLTIDAVEPGSASAVDLVLSVDDPPPSPVAGQPFTTVVQVRNGGTRTASGVVLGAGATAPVGVTVSSAAMGWFALPCTVSPTLGCSLGSLAPGSSAFVVVTAVAPAAGPFEISFSVAGDQVDPDPSTNEVALRGTARTAAG